MAINIAARRGAKAQRRKAVVAEKRKAELEAGTLAGKVRLAQGGPIQHCLISAGLFESGMGMVVLARGETPHSVTMAMFLLDTLALGVKDVFLRPLSGQAFAVHIEQMSIVSPMVPIDPAKARKLLHDLVTWARAHGVAPHRDYPKIEPLFGTVVAAAGDETFLFGTQGSPLLIDPPPGTAPRLIAEDGDAA